MTSAERSAAFPQLPTVAGSGRSRLCRGKPGTDSMRRPERRSDIIARLNRSAAKAVQSDVFKQFGLNEGLVMVGGAPEGLDRYFQRRGGALAQGDRGTPGSGSNEHRLRCGNDLMFVAIFPPSIPDPFFAGSLTG